MSSSDRSEGAMEREEQFKRNHDLFEMFMLEASNDPKLTEHIPAGASVIFSPRMILNSLRPTWISLAQNSKQVSRSCLCG